MKREVALVLGIPSLLLAGFVLGPGDVRAGGRDYGEENVEKKVEKKIRIAGLGGGAFLGVSLGELEEDARGAKVQSVETASPAEKAGIKEGDTIVAFDGEVVRSASQLARLVRETPAGRSVALEVSRSGEKQKLTATLGERRRTLRFAGEDMPLPEIPDVELEMPDFDVEVEEPKVPPHAPAPPGAPRAPVAPHAPPAPMPHAWSWNRGDGHDFVFKMLGGGPRKLGIEYMELGEQLAAYFKLADKKGVLVTAVDADGPAAKAGVKAGDVILELDGKPVRGGEDLQDAVRDAEGGKEVALTVQRDGRSLDLKVTPAKPEGKSTRARGVSL